PKVASNPLLGEIRLAWWREVLDEIYEARHVRHHPTAQALAEVVARHSLPRSPLETMIDARYRELDTTPLSKADATALAFGTAGSAADLVIQVLGSVFEGSFASGWSGIWALSRLILDGRVIPADLQEAESEVRVSVAEARTVERRDITSAAFPAVAHATLAPLYARGRRPQMLEKQARLIWAIATGRI
ncbi:MAG TPA: squalene/phytoene synthase family protein, partial [Phenylobacterium sp.]